jgi:signal peptidase I
VKGSKPAGRDGGEGQDRSFRRIFREYGRAVLIALALAVMIRSAVVEAYVVPTGSMLETIQMGDRILTNKMAYSLRLPLTSLEIAPMGEIRRGDVVVFDPPQGDIPYVKRVIGLPGERIEIRNKVVLVGGKPLSEPYVRYVDSRIYPQTVQPRDNLGPFVVPEGRFFVMGDNRDESFDSRFWGFVDERDIKGRAVAVLWSWETGAWHPRWSRLLRPMN